ncbi:PREDICTED: uncharacterized protein LOC105124525 [Populus euphratica]|uniref:Uncharacterized protein LOC105124525 n=1 Tax=Populus euphratica TaxID=75702 RepID=A0AAJ6XL15_POPEU|nr:PREDICTED: uncharacterized protein LOC105124525 [Populus euphratica]
MGAQTRKPQSSCGCTQQTREDLRRSSSSLASVDHPNRPLTREHGGVMRWPENFYGPREQRKPNCEGTCRPANSLSARAMQQSIFGSMVLQWTLQQPHMTMFTTICSSREIVFSLQIMLCSQQEKARHWFRDLLAPK